MRVFCPEHKRGFLTPRQSPIKCENRGHLLGELDFQGEAKLPLELQWQYCCNCEHFCPIDFDHDGLERCPVCTRRSSILYLCDRCYTVSFESNTPIQSKNFTLSSEGAPQPSCPGCLHETSVDLHEHTCDGLGLSFVTALNGCPICRERLDIGPSFPSFVANYLRRTKAANKFNVTFDYETELFVPVEDGEFVLISTGNESFQTIVLPRTARLKSRRDFYEFYQDYYHCTKPEAGDVHIIHPAVVVPAVGGWKLLATGILEVLEDQPKKMAPADLLRPQVEKLSREKQAISIASIEEQSPVRPCTHCGSLVETRYAFCWKCGNALTNDSSVTHREKPPTTMSLTQIASEDEDDDEELTVQHDVRPAGSPIFSWALAKEPERHSGVKRSVLKLIAVAVVGFILTSLGLFVLARSASRMGSVTAAQPDAGNVQPDPTVAPGQNVKRDVANEPTPQQTTALLPEDAALKTLRERRMGTKASDRSAILQAFLKAEKQYPNDYRFPYERAKLVVKASKSNSHDQAFNALSLAAEKAINTGKAHEMLHGLEADKAGDFQKLSHERHEWKELAQALKNKDASRLNTKGQF